MAKPKSQVRSTHKKSAARPKKSRTRKAVLSAPTAPKTFHFSEETEMVKKHVPALGEITEGVGFGRRLMARLLDTLYVYFVAGSVGLILGVVLGMMQMNGSLDADWKEHLHQFNFLALLVSLLAVVAYHGFMEGICGASAGKLALGLRVVGADSRPCGLMAAVKRNLLYYWDGIFFGLVGLHSMEKSKLNQRYGDAWAGTVVVRSSQVPGSAQRPVWMVFAALVLGSVALALLSAMELLIKAFL